MAEQARQTDPLIDVDHVEMTRYTGISGEILWNTEMIMGKNGKNLPFFNLLHGYAKWTIYKLFTQTV